MLLHTVRFLCSFAAAFARLVRELRKAVAMAAAASSPAISVRHAALPSPPIGLIAAAPLALRRNKQAAPVAVVHQEQLVLLAPPQPVLVVPALCRDVEVQQSQENNRKKKALAVMRKPSKLVIPVADDADEVAAGWGAAAAASENADVEVEGEGLCLASKAGPRHAMEDGYAVITDKNGGDSELAFYGVYDGHGGRAAVDFVSENLGRNVVSAVLAASSEASAKEDAVSAAILAAYLKTDSELLAQQQGANGGACAATAVVTGGCLYVAHLGDCRAVLGRTAGGGATAVALTADHTCASEGERARVERDGGYVSRSGSGVWRVQGSLAVSRAFGDAGLKRWVVAEPAVAAVPLVGCEFLVVASDGLWDKVGNQEAVDAVRRSGAGSRAAACRELVDLARRRGSRDDVTVMVVDLQRFAR
ncbi:hypothetical protein EJB05_28499, partial [Eragrostis curvula]